MTEQIKGIYKFPEHTLVNKKIDFSKIFSKLKLSLSSKKMFNKNIESIIWLNELTGSSLNIETHKDYPVIQIFRVVFKEAFDSKLLEYIDKAVKSKIIYEIVTDNSLFYAVSYKNNYPFFTTEPLNTKNELPIPFVLNTGQLYKELLKSILTIKIRSDEEFNNFIDRAFIFIKKRKQASRLEKKMNREKQFNRRVQMNHELRRLMQEINRLTRVNLQ